MAIQLTKQQKERIRSRLIPLKNHLKGLMELHPVIKEKNWKELIRLFEEGRKAFETKEECHPFSPLAYPDCYMCETFGYQCEFWLGTDKFGGYGKYYNKCPEIALNFCFADPKARPYHPQAREHVFARATVRRKCQERLARYMLKNGETASSVKDITRYCKSVCHRYNECVLATTAFDQFMVCTKVDRDINQKGIEIIGKMLEKCGIGIS